LWSKYKSVKVVVDGDAGEQITHNIFYTAITRVREKLKIYCSPECKKKF
jgi:ATP-dependent exoDNAse (exonuclease V) alpha subunit